jgi:hypothetical protein
LQVDPLALFEHHLSPYNYCANNPVNYSDPYGDRKDRKKRRKPSKKGDSSKDEPENANDASADEDDTGGSDRGTLPPGTHTVVVTDQNGVEYNVTVTVDLDGNIVLVTASQSTPGTFGGTLDASVPIVLFASSGQGTSQSGSYYFTGSSPYSTWNGLLIIFYEHSAGQLKGAFTGPNGIDYEGGKDARFNLKTVVRNWTLGPQKKVLNALDPLKPSLKAQPRFWVTNKGWNYAGKLSAATGIFGLSVAGYRIATANDKLHETGKVVSGFAGAWLGMQAVTPLATAAGAISGPGAPFVSGAILFVGGVAGAFVGEEIYDYVSQ